MDFLQELNSIIVYTYVFAVIFFSWLARKLIWKRKWKMDFTYFVLILAAVIGVVFYLIEKGEVTHYIVSYAFATTLYELIMKRLMEGLKIQ